MKNDQSKEKAGANGGLEPAECIERLKFETLMTDLSARFIHLPAEQVDDAIVDAQRRICECTGLDVVVLWQWEVDAPGVFTLTHHYRRREGPPLTRQLPAAEFFPWSLREVQAGRSFLLASLNEVPEGAERDQASFRYFGVLNALVLPLSVGAGGPFGAITFHDMVVPRVWSDALVHRLELVARIFANALARRRYEETLQDREDRLALAADSAGVGLWSLDLATGRYWLTDKAKETFGFGPEEEVTLERVLAAVLPEDRILIRQVIDEMVATGKDGRVEYRIVRPDGNVRWVVSRGRVHGSSGKLPTHLMGVTTDITDPKNAAGSLKQSEFRLAAAMDAAELGFYEVANGDHVAFLDRRAREIIGAAAADEEAGRIFKFWGAHVHPEDLPHVMELNRALNQGGQERLTVDYRFLNPERGVIHVHHLVHVIERDVAGRAVRTIGVLQDVTERKELELEARRTQNELAHATRMSVLGELAASMAHELNQPLAAILSNAQAARRFLAAPEPDMQEIREILDDIVRDDKRAGDVIHHMRAMVQKKGSVVAETLDFNGLVSDTAKLAHSELVGRNIGLKLDLAPPLPAILAGRVEMQQVLLNLMVNAMDAMRDQPAERRLLQIRTSAVEGWVRVALRDHGHGIPENAMADIFLPFFTTKTQGLGMGLSISRSMVEAHGGKLWAENAPDGGAIFWIEMPVRKEEKGTMGEEQPRGEGNSRGEGYEPENA